MSDTPPTDNMEEIRRRPAWWRRLSVLDEVAILCMLPSIVAGTAKWWWIGDLCVHFRMPYAVMLAVLAVIYFVRRRWRWLLPVGVVLGVNISLLLPLYVGGSGEGTATGHSLRMMVANVYIGNSEPAPLLKAIREEQPDVLLLLEVDDRWLEQLAELRDEYPYMASVIRDEGYGSFGPFGQVLFSRIPLGEPRIHRLGTKRIPVLVTTLEHEGRTWSVIGAHPYPPVSPACSTARDTLLAELGELVAETPDPKVLLGDLNITRWSPHFADLLATGGVRDSSLGFGYQPTWPDVMGVAVIPIDHVLVSVDVAVLDRRVGPPIASDHRPVIVDLAEFSPQGL